ncbi:zinc finger protein 593-like [Sycon ciliatum]|uniref:zinc finger protein 593-like n=1 Tax=Sycon ciliatum TaxID=27933 RepID=UPI0020ACB1C4|eukprot:scpid94499/ scgid14716/ Zinc finger protein 593
MGRLRRKRMHKNIRDTKRKFRTKRRTKDMDQIHDDLKEVKKLTTQPIDYDLPGAGQYYCVECARYFTDGTSKEEHIKSKLHKRRLKELKNIPYTQEEADRASGMGSYHIRHTKGKHAEIAHNVALDGSEVPAAAEAQSHMDEESDEDL